MWITATEAIEIRGAIEKAMPEITKRFGEGITIDEVAKTVREDLKVLRNRHMPLPTSFEAYRTADWEKRERELSEVVPHLYGMHRHFTQ